MPPAATDTEERLSCGPPSVALGYTVPELARILPVPLDKLRRTLRRRPELKTHFVTVGPTRLVPTEKLESFRAALAACSGSSPNSNATAAPSPGS